jgi:hypothetical protein
MLPTDVPRGLDDLTASLRSLGAPRGPEALARRLPHHSACSGDGPILDMIRRDLAALQRFEEQVQLCTLLVSELRTAAVRRLATLAAAEQVVRAALPTAGPIVVADVNRHVSLSPWGVGGWIACAGGAAAVPLTGDPCWFGLLSLVR